MRDRFDELRAAEHVSPADLEALWGALPTVRPDEILGSWRGGDFAAAHPLSEVLKKLDWHGKRFDSTLDAHPLICRDADGALYSNTKAAGGRSASLWPVGVLGSAEVTATMVYDALPVFDHFKRVDDDTLMGRMSGKLEEVFVITDPYYFWLERE